MKTFLVFLTCLLFIASDIQAQKADEEAIKKVVQQETSSFFHKDYNKWEDTWAKDSMAFVMRVGPDEHYVLSGWNNIAAAYKGDIQSLPVFDDAAIATYSNKTDWKYYINGNMAIATFKEGNKMPSVETRTLVKQNGAWKLLNMTIIDGNYGITDVTNTMKALAGKWEYEPGSFSIEPNDSSSLKSLNVEFKATPTGFEQWSTISYVLKNQTYNPPAECEYFIPDYNQSEIKYVDIQRNNAGATYPNFGHVTSNQDNSFTVTTMYSDKPTVMQSEYTVTLKDGRWHQVLKQYSMDGKLTLTLTFDMHRA